MTAAPGCTHQALSKQSSAELRITRNTVFARHGRAFSSGDLRAHFEGQPWYTPDSDYDDSRLTEADHACIARVGIWEKSAGTMWKEQADLDGDGVAEPIWVLAQTSLLIAGPESDAANPCEELESCPGVVIAGDASAGMAFNWPEGAYFGEKTYSIIDIDPTDGHKELLITQRRSNWDDPPYLNRLFIYRSRALTVHALDGGSYDSGTIEVPGDGRIALVDADCATQSTTWYRLDGSRLEQVEVITTEVPGAEDFKLQDGTYACPACPAVYVEGGGQALLAGEILRNLAAPSRRGWQRLYLPTSAARIHGDSATVTVRIAEEKPEVTHLDAVRLVMGAQAFLPESCVSGAAPWCADDGQVLELAPGQSQVFTFEVPAGAVDMGLWLEALGHYEPITNAGALP